MDKNDTICRTCLRLRQGLCDGEKELTACLSYKRMTNSDRIRNMTDEELADCLDAVHHLPLSAEYCQLVRDGLNPGFCDDKCKDCILEWLKQEVFDNG